MTSVITRFWRWLTDRSSEEAAASETATDTQDTASSSDPCAAFSGESLNKAELLQEVGMTPQEFLLGGLTANGGRLRQQEIVEYSGWSASTVSRTLSAMEKDGCIIRVKIGRQKIVYLPEEVPEQIGVGVPDRVGDGHSPADQLGTGDDGERGQSSV